MRTRAVQLKIKFLVFPFTNYLIMPPFKPVLFEHIIQFVFVCGLSGSVKFQPKRAGRQRRMQDGEANPVGRSAASEDLEVMVE